MWKILLNLFCYMVKNLDEVERLVYEYHDKTKLKDKNGKKKNSVRMQIYYLLGLLV
ncbi:hypothetical protein SEEN199_12195 [Salmonella enterica subsp. enterica serovar Newport str. CVM 35199]|nr:hypothetical protein SEEN199_12195 [Salmonella enterica subsp. enterica serovar Newport str. CVM 35199]